MPIAIYYIICYHIATNKQGGRNKITYQEAKTKAYGVTLESLNDYINITDRQYYDLRYIAIEIAYKD